VLHVAEGLVDWADWELLAGACFSGQGTSLVSVARFRLKRSCHCWTSWS